MKPVYLDYNATTPIAREVAEAMIQHLHKDFGNPSSSHIYGVTAKRAVEVARAQVADFLGCRSEEVIFTSGGTESNNHAIRGIAFAYREQGNHIITSAIEHPSVIEVCRYLETQGFHLTVLPVDESGLVDPAELERAMTPKTILVTIMHANNEVGTIQPVAELAKIAHKNGAFVHTDAAQSAGKIQVNVKTLGVDLLAIAGHKIYGPKGVGALYIKHGIKLAKLLHGAMHEGGRRPGTENVMQIVGLGKACYLANRYLARDSSHFRTLRDQLHQGLLQRLGKNRIRLNGHHENRLPNTLSLSFHNIDANTLLSEINNQVAASPGAACHTGKEYISPTIEAMKVPHEWAIGTVRFSVGRDTTTRDVNKAVRIITKAVIGLRPEAKLDSPVSPKRNRYKLTQYTQGLGCACKLRPQALEKILTSLPIPVNPDIIVGIETVDDAAVYRLSNDLAIVQTVDFFTPIVDDPYSFGAISAANSLSDIYAMGATPIFALNIAGFPSRRLPLYVLEQILKGAADKANEAGISIIGGHTVDDNEPKFGLAVSGVVHPDKVIRNSTASPGDVLVLTKPLGVGIISTAIKRGLASEEVTQKAVELMEKLNNSAAEAMIEIGANACTDITGFGLLGHLREMAIASKVDIILNLNSIPIIPAVWDLATANMVPGGTINNLNYVKSHVEFDSGVSEIGQLILADAQTSGGLLISLPPEKAQRILKLLQKRGGKEASIIGTVTRKGRGHIRVKS